METHQQHQNNTENDVEKQSAGVSESRQEPETEQPSSRSSSPSHEFSFTISLHSTISDNKSKIPPSLAVDLSPADEIFFHGHLLPLHLLSHFPSSPRISTNSIDNLSLPIKDLLLEDEKIVKDSGSCSSSNRSNITIEDNSIRNRGDSATNRGTKEESKSKNSTFSLFGSTKGRKDYHVNVKDREEKEKQKGRNLMHALKKYLRIVLFRGRKEKIGLNGNGYSHSGNLMRRNKPELRGRRGEYSAPASMRTSPTNSGLLLSTTTLPSNDSTMEELQAAIQAAIAHCKNSIAKEDKLIDTCAR